MVEFSRIDERKREIFNERNIRGIFIKCLNIVYVVNLIKQKGKEKGFKSVEGSKGIYGIVEKRREREKYMEVNKSRVSMIISYFAEQINKGRSFREIESSFVSKEYGLKRSLFICRSNLCCISLV